jgi:pyruvate dehydrogenase E2 component (dihydrolipoamide acetyltransferase)
MPSLGADMEFGTIAQWLVKPGDRVKRGDIVAVVETEKSTIEVEIFENGVLDQLVVHEGERVPVGTVLAHLSAPAPGVPGPVRRPVAPTEPVAPTAVAPSAVAPSAIAPAPAAPSAGRARVASPMVRRLAEQLGVDLAGISGSGPGGLVTRADVEQASQHGRAEPLRRVRSSPLARRRAAELGVDLSTLRGSGPGGSVIERDVGRAAPGVPERTPAAASAEQRQAAMRRAIGALMARSKREIPHYYLSTTIDLSTATAWLEQANLERPVPERLVLSVLLLKATARAVKSVPEMNGFMLDDDFQPSAAVHVGVAVSLRTGGVIAPAIHDVDQLALGELMAKLKDLVGRARTGVLRSSEMSDATITVTNLGDRGVESVFGVIYPPQVALVGFGQVTERPWAHNGELSVRPCVTVSLSADHRVSDGHRGGRFLTEIERLLQEPEKL